MGVFVQYNCAAIGKISTDIVRREVAELLVLCLYLQFYYHT